jgi:hypothetical protein
MIFILENYSTKREKQFHRPESSPTLCKLIAQKDNPTITFSKLSLFPKVFYFRGLLSMGKRASRAPRSPIAFCPRLVPSPYALAVCPHPILSPSIHFPCPRALSSPSLPPLSSAHVLAPIVAREHKRPMAKWCAIALQSSMTMDRVMGRMDGPMAHQCVVGRVDRPMAH